MKLNLTALAHFGVAAAQSLFLHVTGRYSLLSKAYFISSTTVWVLELGVADRYAFPEIVSRYGGRPLGGDALASSAHWFRV